jgi:hypothetical protein
MQYTTLSFSYQKKKLFLQIFDLTMKSTVQLRNFTVYRLGIPGVQCTSGKIIHLQVPSTALTVRI